MRRTGSGEESGSEELACHPVALVDIRPYVHRTYRAYACLMDAVYVCEPGARGDCRCQKCTQGTVP